MRDAMNIEMLPVSEMKIDLTYQRLADIEDKRVQSIAQNWDDRKANLIHISKRTDGSLFVIDGNHTRLGYLLAGGEKLPCRVYENLTLDEEARLFFELNISQKKPKYAEILKAKAAAGCEMEKEYLRCLEEAKVPFSLSQSSGMKIKCHAALMQIFKTTNYATMLRALIVARRCADGREVFYTTGYFPGLVSFICCHPEADDNRLINVLRNTPSSQVKERADFYRKTALSGSTSATKDFRKAYIDLYNRGLRKHKISEGEK